MSRFNSVKKALKLLALGATGITVAGVTALQYTSAIHAKELDNFKRDEVSLDKLPSRAEIVKKLKSVEYDVLIIGGGASGLGIALDAQTRGLETALVELDDYASGTSSRSTKLIHGGVRYLEKAFKNLDIGQYKLVEEALQEREFFFKVAPHLTRPLPIILPIYDSFPEVLFFAPYYWIGCKMYDLVAGKHALEPSYWLGRREALERFPMLKHNALKGGVVYYDGQQNDTRMAVAIAQTAIAMGASCANHIEVTSLSKNAQGKVCGAKVRDRLSGEEWEIKSKSVVNATGPFSDSIRLMDDPKTMKIIAPSSGVHIMLSDRYSPEGMGLIAPSSDGRVLFLLPWEHSTIAGTTDSSTEITTLPRPQEQEIEFILEEIRKFLEVPVKREDVDAAWSGIRPLARDPNAKDTASISRDHVIEVSKSGMVTIAGGKWTTYRKMAEDTVDRVIKENPELKAKAKPCTTLNTALIGAAGWSLAMPSALVRNGFSREVAEHLSHNYGDKAPAVAHIAIEENTASTLASGWPFIEAEVLYGIRHEYAQTAIDILARRTRLSFLHRDAAFQALPRVLELMSKELKWDSSRRAQEEKKALEFLNTMNGANPPKLTKTIKHTL